jgi:hypothetical protein
MLVGLTHASSSGKMHKDLHTFAVFYGPMIINTRRGTADQTV